MKRIISKFKNNRILSNISWILAGKIIYMALSFFVGIQCARFLGPSNYGLIGYAASYTTFFYAICTLGLDSIIIKEFIDNKKSEGEVLGTAILMKLISSIISYIFITIICLIVDFNEPTTRIVVAIYSVSILFQIFETIKYWFQSKLQSKYSELVVTIAYIVMATYKIILLVNGKSVEWFAFSNSVEFFVVGLLLYIIYKKKGGPKLRFSLQQAKKMLGKSYHFILSGLMVAIYNSTDKFMLKQMMNETEVSYYTIAVTISGLVAILLNAIIASLTPVILEAHNTDDAEYKRRNRQLYFLVFYISFVTSTFICVLAPFIVNLLYGSSYSPAIYPLRILTWYTAFSYLGVARDPWIISENKQKYLKYIYIGCAILNIGLNYVLIPILGASGAAIASLITQFATIFVFPLFIKELRSNVKLITEGIFFKIAKK